MNRWWGRWALLGAAVMAVGGSALAQGGPGSPKEPLSKAEKKHDPMQAQAMEMGRMMIADGEQGFLSQLHEMNQTEITLGELTLQKSLNPTVKQYGERMVRDHKKADQQLMDLAKQRGYQLSSMVEPTNDVQRRLRSATEATKAKLPVLQGMLYDQEYLASQVAAHDETLEMVRLGRQLYPQLASLLDEMTPVIQGHRDQACQLLEQVKPQAQASQQQQPTQQRQARPPSGERR